MQKDFKAKWVDYIENEFIRREEGMFFMNNGATPATLSLALMSGSATPTIADNGIMKDIAFWRRVFSYTTSYYY